MKSILAALLMALAPLPALAQSGGNPSNAVGIWGQDSGTGLPCIVAPSGGSATCVVPTTGGGGGGGGAVTLAAGAVAAGAYVSGSVLSGAFATGSIVDLASFKTANHTDLGTLNTTLGTPFQAGGSIGNTTFGATATGTTSTNGSTTITTGGSFQTLLASNSSRKGCLIQNPITATEPLYVSVTTATGSATTATSFGLNAGATFSCAVGGGYVVTDNIAVDAATTGHAFVVSSQ